MKMIENIKQLLSGTPDRISTFDKNLDLSSYGYLRAGNNGREKWKCYFWTSKMYSTQEAKRRQNEKYRENRLPQGTKLHEEGFSNHHINHAFTLAMPSFLHRSIKHSLRTYPH